MLIFKIKSILVLLIVLVIKLQVQGQTAGDSIILSAMQDELNRSMSELNKKDHDKPFFISYTIANFETIAVSAKLGALTSSNENKNKDWQVRVMVGNYDLNDENFVSGERQQNENRFPHQMPVDDNYIGIRMALWSQTDAVYNSAASLYKQKKLLIDEKKVEEELLELSDFSKTQVVNINIPQQEKLLDKSEIENKAKTLSNSFLSYPEILNSGVSIKQFIANVYFLNSEGSKVVFPFSFSTINVFFSSLSEDNDYDKQNLSYNNLSVNDLPDNEIILKDIDYMIQDIKFTRELESFEEDYSGPVLFYGSLTANVFESALFSRNGSLIAQRSPLKRKDQYTNDFKPKSNNKKWELGEEVIDTTISVVDYSSMENFQGTELWGNYRVDAEGVIPDSSLSLIENGILLNKLNGRTPADDVEVSNGHMRNSMQNYGFSKSIAPGIIKLTSTNTKTYAELKEALIELAKKEDYDFGILIKSAPVNSYNAPYEYYKVDVNTGEETRIADVKYNSIKDRQFKKIVGFSDELIVNNKFFSGGNYINGAYPNMSGGSRGVPVSYIVPSAILLKRVELNTIQQREYRRKKPIVDSPINSVID